jgi:hypothetical protein
METEKKYLEANRIRNKTNYWLHHEEQKEIGRLKRAKYYKEHHDVEKVKGLLRYYRKKGDENKVKELEERLIGILEAENSPF